MNTTTRDTLRAAVCGTDTAPDLVEVLRTMTLPAYEKG